MAKVAGGLRAIVNLPKAERETMRQTLNAPLLGLVVRAFDKDPESLDIR